MDPMARTYGRLDHQEIFDLWTTGLPIMDILEAEARLSHGRRSANDNGGLIDPGAWGMMRDHWSGNLSEWCGQAEDLRRAPLTLVTDEGA